MGRGIRGVIAVLAMLVAGSTCAQVNALPQARHILVYGDAQARAVPDRFRIELSFDVVDPKADLARAKVESYMQDAIAQLRRIGVADSEIVATSLEIEPRNEYDQEARKQQYRGVGVKRTLSARFENQEDLKAFLARLETSGQVQVSGVQTELSSKPQLMAQLRRKAIESTREKAKVIADAYGARLGAIYSVSDTAPQFEYGIQEGDWPVMYEWRTSDDGSTELDRIEVTGSRVANAPPESFQTGYVTFQDRIYTVFLLAD